MLTEISAELGTGLLLHGFVVRGNHNNRQGDLWDFSARPKKPADNSSWIQRILLTALDPLSLKARPSASKLNVTEARWWQVLDSVVLVTVAATSTLGSAAVSEPGDAVTRSSSVRRRYWAHWRGGSSDGRQRSVREQRRQQATHGHRSGREQAARAQW
ncbi:hypothetical protein NL676_023998 [Syzygium grande]|nr:hypothetical protein NL676_023998 [Syzygium grande]